MKATKAIKTASKAKEVLEDIRAFSDQVKSLESMANQAAEALHKKGAKGGEEDADKDLKNMLKVTQETLATADTFLKATLFKKTKKGEFIPLDDKAMKGKWRAAKQKGEYTELREKLQNNLNVLRMTMVFGSMPQHSDSMAELSDTFNDFDKFVRGTQDDGLTLPIILWVDDEPTNNTAAINMLTRFGFNVLVTGSTESALGLVRDGKIRLWKIFSDMHRREHIAGGDYYIDDTWAGLELLRALKGMRVTTPTYILAKNRCARTDVREACAALGAAGAVSFFHEVLEYFIDDDKADEASKAAWKKISDEMREEKKKLKAPSIGDDPLPAWAEAVREEWVAKQKAAGAAAERKPSAPGPPVPAAPSK